jgi:RNA polymerase sigma-70 factor (ECF subfamily)
VAKVDLDEILRRACRRDPEALSALVDLYSPRVFGLLYRLSGSRDAAEELMQETFLRVVRTIGQYEHSGKFESWLFRIAANLARDRARSGRRRGWTTSLEDGGPQAEEPAASDQAAAEYDPQRRLLNKEAGKRLEMCLQRLSEPEREILMLRHFSGLSFPEIARILGVPVGTALARAHRALNRLRTEFGSEA